MKFYNTDAMRIQGWLDFEDRNWLAHNFHALQMCCQPFTTWQYFEVICLDELSEVCGNISRVLGFQGMVKFLGNMVIK